MKLQAEKKRAGTILRVGGPLTPEDIRILRVGVTHMIKSGTRDIVLDLNPVEDPKPEILIEAARVRFDAMELSAHLVVACQTPGIGACATPTEGLLLLGKRDQIAQTTFEMYIDKLERLPLQKVEAEKVLSKMGRMLAQFHALEVENEDLNRVNSGIEKLIAESNVGDYPITEEEASRWKQVKTVLRQALEKFGLPLR